MDGNDGMDRGLLLVNESRWRPPEDDLPNGVVGQHYEVPVYNQRKCNKIESAGKKKLTVAPYDVASKKIKKERSSLIGSKKISIAQELGIQLRDEEEELEEEEFDVEEVKKINHNFEKGHVVYGDNEAVRNILNQFKALEGSQGVISFNFMDEIRISPKKLYDVTKNFTRGDLLGEGGVGKVHLVTDNLSKKEFVEKTIKKDKFAKKEVEVLLNLQHKNITEFYGLKVYEELISLFMSFAGTSLETLVLRKGMVFSEDIVIHFSLQALSALAYMDRYRMVHMDIKPQNICIQEATGHLSLTDFGSSLTPQQSLDFTGVTPEYMSPELCQMYVNECRVKQNKLPCYQINTSEINGKNDVYAWACTMCFVFLRHHSALMIMNLKFQDCRLRFLLLIASNPHLMSKYVPNTITADLRNGIVQLLNGAVKERPDAEQGKLILEEIQKRRYNNEQAYQPLECADEKLSSIKLKLKEKIESNKRKDESEPSTTRPPEIQPTVEITPDESSKTTQNIPNFDSLF